MVLWYGGRSMQDRGAFYEGAISGAVGARNVEAVRSAVVTEVIQCDRPTHSTDLRETSERGGGTRRAQGGERRGHVTCGASM